MNDPIFMHYNIYIKYYKLILKQPAWNISLQFPTMWNEDSNHPDIFSVGSLYYNNLEL